MLVAIDIGNTHTVVGLFQDRNLLFHWRITSNLGRTEDETGAILNYLFEKEGYDASQVAGVCISSVVPDLTPAYILMSKRYFKTQPVIISNKLKLDLGVKIREPESVGADRLCNAVAAKEKYGKPVIVLDFGTATTFDCINSEGNYVGGIICPGIQTSVDTLHSKAAKLPRVELKFPDNVIGRSTDESIQSGILNGTIHLIEGLTSDIKKELGERASVIATGGLASKISPKTNSIDKVDLYLSLEGIASIYYKNNQ